MVGGKRSTMEMNQTVVPNGLFGIQSQNVCSEVIGLVPVQGWSIGSLPRHGAVW